MRFRNVSPLGERSIPALNLHVPAGAEFDVPAAAVASIALQTENYQPVDDEARAATAALAGVEAPASAYAGLTVKQLRAELAERALSTAGSKAELVDRLVAADAAGQDHTNENEETL